MLLESFFAASPDLEALESEAAAQGIWIGQLIGAGGYGGVFEVPVSPWNECVVKIAGVEFGGRQHYREGDGGRYRDAWTNGVFLIGGPSWTGPMGPVAPATLDQAKHLLKLSCGRHTEAETPLLPCLFASLELAGRPVALYERLRGRSLRALMAENLYRAREMMPLLVRALMQLHDTFGGHGDLKPDHVFIDEGTLRFIDPLPRGGGLWGSFGYTSPFLMNTRDLRLTDLGSLAAMLAELWNGNVLWDYQAIYCPCNEGNGRFACEQNYQERLLERMREGVADVPESLRKWIMDAGSGGRADWQRGAVSFGEGGGDMLRRLEGILEELL